LLNLRQGQFLPKAMADLLLNRNVLRKEFWVVLTGQEQGGSRAENAEAAAETRHAQVIRRMMWHAAGMNPLPDLSDRPRVNGQPGINHTTAVAASWIVAERLAFGAGRAFIGTQAQAVEDANRLIRRAGSPGQPGD
jgi:hypothetical protein